MAKTLPYISTPGHIARVLERIKQAATPQRFTQDFLASTIAMKGGSARELIPYLKRIGLLATDGAPTALYKEYRNTTQSKLAAAKALRIGYAPLFEMNENADSVDSSELRGMIMQVTGSEQQSRVLQLTISCFNQLKSGAAIGPLAGEQLPAHLPEVSQDEPMHRKDDTLGLNLSYTINLNLPATSDVDVFNAIFKSLRDNLLKE